MVKEKSGITIKEWNPVENTVKRNGDGKIIAQDYVVPITYKNGEKTEMKIKSTLIRLGDLNEFPSIVKEEIGDGDPKNPLLMVKATLRFLQKFVSKPDLSCINAEDVTGKACDEVECVLSFLMKESGYEMGDDTKNFIPTLESSEKSSSSDSYINVDTNSQVTGV